MMKVHYEHPTYGVCCNTNRTRRTTHKNRTTTDKDKVTCATCQKMHHLVAEVVA
jgi:hypothetical protein